MDAQTPRTILLAGTLGASEMASIANYCDQLHRGGQTELHLNMSAVTDCRRAGLAGLEALAAGSSAMAVSIGGARWGQFTALLSTAPMLDLQDLCDSVHALVHGEAPSGVGSGPGPPPSGGMTA
ncbi:hypothetical protein PHK61_17120 [Actinomycetospora lutea]|uniref:hypothetical protein n=1 Tax=Actinomycetospora lutea TaxID=663604 RepID=UPI0023661B43|nr:hypothetical protein [Actinomycetospora lutea]MDD7940146.1 hypothetical protein [Actinomycetospora lutea]